MYADPALFRSAVPPFRCRYDSDHEPAEFYRPPALTHFALIFNSRNHIRPCTPPSHQPLPGGSAPQLHCCITETVSTCPHRWRKLLLLLLFNCQYSSDYFYLTQEPRLVFVPNSTILLQTKKWLINLQIQTGVLQRCLRRRGLSVHGLFWLTTLYKIIRKGIFILMCESYLTSLSFSIPRLYVKVLSV